MQVIGALCLVGAEATDPAPTKGGLLDGNLDQEEDAETADILRYEMDQKPEPLIRRILTSPPPPPCFFLSFWGRSLPCALHLQV